MVMVANCQELTNKVINILSRWNVARTVCRTCIQLLDDSMARFAMIASHLRLSRSTVREADKENEHSLARILPKRAPDCRSAGATLEEHES